MIRVNSKKIFLSTLIIIIAAVFWPLWRVWYFPDTTWPLEKGEKTKIDSEVIQKFSADRDGLSKIAVLFGDSDVSPGGTFNFELLDENCRETIRSANLEIKKLDSDNTTDFVFSRIDKSKGKTYCVRISYAQKKGGKKARIFVIENPKPENSYFSINGEEMAGQSISMRPAYKNASIFEDIGELNRRISQYKPWFLKHYFLYFIAFGFIILSVLAVSLLIHL
ncbi:MAG: hypothetical protein A2259_02010 [Candidatus Moranbacteria bacterium RIFOXYA2_FULL_43_15]|nr:MAG: hypothetical protein A2259_02010 [Candidatus Moranbacteria bacterium RIFOXYA2_FULL_43_15]